MTSLTRREVLARLVAIGSAGVLSAVFSAPAMAQTGTPAARTQAGSQLPAPSDSGIQHVVVMMMENRSFDHFLGWLPHAVGRQAGLSYPDRTGVPRPTHPLAPDFQGCGLNDPDHTFDGGRVEYDGARCDGWLRAGNNDIYSIGYYTQPDLAFLGQVAPHFATADHYFAAILGPTFPNRLYQHAAQTDRLSNTFNPSTLPTIWDRLQAACVSGRYYYGDIPFTALWGVKYQPISRPYIEFLNDAAAGTLPNVAFVDGQFVGELSGTGNDDHPHADIRRGERFMHDVYHTVTSGPNWKNTVLVINFDEWGGYFDHVPPPTGPVTAAEQALGYTDGLRGFRVPCVVISPWSQGPRVPHAVYDHTSVLKMIEWRFGLAPLAVRDAAARNLAEVLDFENPRLAVPQPVVPDGPYGVPCADTGVAAGIDDDADAFGTHFHGERLAELRSAPLALGSRIVNDSRIWKRGIDGADRDDGSALSTEQVRQGCARRTNGRHEVDVQCLHPLIVGERQDRCVRGCTAPTLLTRMSRAPNVDMVSATSRVGPSRVVRSTAT